MILSAKAHARTQHMTQQADQQHSQWLSDNYSRTCFAQLHSQRDI